jgi:hypothetical protein
MGSLDTSPVMTSPSTLYVSRSTLRTHRTRRRLGRRRRRVALFRSIQLFANILVSRTVLDELINSMQGQSFLCNSSVNIKSEPTGVSYMLQRPVGGPSCHWHYRKNLPPGRPAAAAAPRRSGRSPDSGLQPAFLASFFARSPYWIARPTECVTQTIA